MDNLRRTFNVWGICCKHNILILCISCLLPCSYIYALLLTLMIMHDVPFILVIHIGMLCLSCMESDTLNLALFVCTVNSRYSGHPWDYPMWLEYRDGRISGYLEIPAAIFETVSRASSPACKVIVTG